MSKENKELEERWEKLKYYVEKMNADLYNNIAVRNILQYMNKLEAKMENKPIIRILESKDFIFHHASVLVTYPQAECLYADDVKSVTCKSDIIFTLHGFTKNHVLKRVMKYLKKRGLIEGDDNV